MPLPYDLDFLRVTLLAVLSSGTAGLATVWVMNNIAALRGIEGALQKRVVAFALSALFAGAVYAAAVVMLYLPPPADWRQVVEALSSLGSLAFAVSQAAHGRMKDTREAGRAEETRLPFRRLDVDPETGMENASDPVEIGPGDIDRLNAGE